MTGKSIFDSFQWKWNFSTSPNINLLVYNSHLEAEQMWVIKGHYNVMKTQWLQWWTQLSNQCQNSVYKLFTVRSFVMRGKTWGPALCCSKECVDVDCKVRTRVRTQDSIHGRSSEHRVTRDAMNGIHRVLFFPLSRSFNILLSAQCVTSIVHSLKLLICFPEF